MEENHKGKLSGSTKHQLIHETGCLKRFYAKCWQAATMDQSQAASAAVMKMGNGPNKHLAGWEVTASPSAGTYI